jgi:hypothetical protein
MKDGDVAALKAEKFLQQCRHIVGIIDTTLQGCTGIVLEMIDTDTQGFSVRHIDTPLLGVG